MEWVPGPCAGCRRPLQGNSALYVESLATRGVAFFDDSLHRGSVTYWFCGGWMQPSRVTRQATVFGPRC